VSRRTTRVVSAAAVAAVAALTTAVPAFAHATLEETEPARGTTVKVQPKAIVFHFSERVEMNFSAVHVYDAVGRPVDDGRPVHPGGVSSDVAIGFAANRGMPQGTYTATYRVISADGHPVSGGFLFSIGKAGAAPAKTVAELAGGSDVGSGTTIAFGVARAVQYGAIALAIGALAFLLLPWVGGLRAVAGGGPEWQEASEAFLARSRLPFLVAVLAGAISGIGGIVLQGQTAVGGSVFDAMGISVIQGVLETHFGLIWGLRVLAWLGLGGVLLLVYAREQLPVMRPATLSAAGLALTRGFGSKPQLAVLLALLGFLGISPALAGHANAQDPTAVLLPSTAAHVIAMSVWIGGLVMLLVVLPRATRLLELPDRSRLLAAVLSRFSTIAGACVAVVLLSGIVQSFVYVRNLDNLLHTEYGQILLAKVVIFVILMGLGGYNRQFSVPRLNKIAAGRESPGRAGVLLRRALRGEVLMVTAVLGVTGALAGFAPATAAEATTGPFAKTDMIGPAQIQLTVDPARVGANLMHLYLLEPTTGAQWDKAKEVRVKLVQREKKIELGVDARKGGPGHYIVDGAVFSTGGTWEVQIATRVSEFDEYAKTIEVPIR
jgi:copper transport protein